MANKGYRTPVPSGVSGGDSNYTPKEQRADRRYDRAVRNEYKEERQEHRKSSFQRYLRNRPQGAGGRKAV